MSNCKAYYLEIFSILDCFQLKHTTTSTTCGDIRSKLIDEAKIKQKVPVKLHLKRRSKLFDPQTVRAKSMVKIKNTFIVKKNINIITNIKLKSGSSADLLLRCSFTGTFCLVFAPSINLLLMSPNFKNVVLQVCNNWLVFQLCCVVL